MVAGARNHLELLLVAPNVGRGVEWDVGALRGGRPIPEFADLGIQLEELAELLLLDFTAPLIDIDLHRLATDGP